MHSRRCGKVVLSMLVSVAHAAHTHVQFSSSHHHFVGHPQTRALASSRAHFVPRPLYVLNAPASYLLLAYWSRAGMAMCTLNLSEQENMFWLFCASGAAGRVEQTKQQ
jgi:hypothetical protein